MSTSDSLVCLADSSVDDECAMSCTCLSSCQQSPNSATFNEEENEQFRKRQDEGYDIITDHWYNLWLSLQEGTEKSLGNTEPSTLKQKPKQVPSTFLSLELPPLPHQPKPSGCAHVLTSLECLRLLEEKQCRKHEKTDMKEKRKKDREEKRREETASKGEATKEGEEIGRRKERKEKEAIEKRSGEVGS